MGEGGYKQINKSFNASVFEDYLKKQQAGLPHLNDVEQLSPRVLRVLGQNAGKFTLQGTNTYIVGTGSKRLIIDTAQGFREWSDLLDDTMSAKGISLSHVFLTHWHGDHTGGVPDLIRMYPDLSESIYKNSPDAGQQPIKDGQTFHVEGATIRAIHSPGHSHDHMCFVLEEENAMFTGDNVLGHGTSVAEELSIYMDTLKKLKSQDCAIGYPAHGAMIPNLRAKLAGELAAKTRREKKCIHALHDVKQEAKSSPGQIIPGATVPELVKRMHGEQLNQEVQALALEPFVNEVLEKLAIDGQVGWQVRGGVREWFAVTV